MSGTSEPDAPSPERPSPEGAPPDGAPSARSPARGVAGLLRTILATAALWCYRRPILALILLAAIGAAGAVPAGRLQLDPDITRLLPDTFDSVVQIQRLRQRFGGVGNVVLVLEGGSREARQQYAEALAPKLAELPSVKYVDHKVPVDFFVDHGLYFADKADLETLRARLDARRRWEIERAFVDVDDEAPPSVDASDLRAKYETRFAETLGPAGEKNASAYHEDDAGTRLAIFVRPNELATDLSFARKVVGEVEGALGALPATAFDPGIKVELTGRYKKRVDLQALLGRDLNFTSWLAAALVIGYVALHFRRILAVVMVLLPLGLGVLLSYGLAGAVFGKLNILTAFIGAILVGISIDNGLHLLGRYQEEIRSGAPAEHAIATAFGESGRVALAAALSTASAFVALTWTDFRAFREFGVLAASGMIFLVLSYVVMLPALLGLLSRFAPRLGAPAEPRHLPLVGPMRRFGAPLFWLFAVGGFLVVTHASQMRFDADFSKLDDADLPSFHLDKEVNRLLGHSQTPLVVLADTPAQAREVADVVRKQMRALGPEATVGLVMTRADILPDDQAEKREVMEKISTILARFEGAKLDDETRSQVERLRRMVDAKPFTADDLPPSLRHVFAGKEGTGPAEFVLLYPTVSLGEAAAIKRVATQLRRIDLPSGGSVTAAGEPMVLADVLITVQRDAPRIFGLTLVLVLMSLILALGKLRLAILALLPALFTLSATAGGAALFGVELNYLNMIMLPILLGIGVDDGAHLVARVDAGEDLGDVWTHTGWDVTGAILTDVFGFGVLALASHPGLASLGKLALIGLTINFLACVVVLPAALAFLPLVGPARPRWSLSAWLITSFGAGTSPKAPGTVGALVGIPIAWALSSHTPAIKIAVLVALTIVGIVASARYLREGTASGLPPSARPDDPQEIVIDETIGAAIAMSFVPFEPAWIAAGFVLFRFLDIVKPPPIRWVEKKLHGALGVILDDVVAGVIAAGILMALSAFVFPGG